MAVYFIYRSAYEFPLGRRIVTFEEDDLLSWFQRVWPERTGKGAADSDSYDKYQRMASRAGLKNIYGIGDLFEQMELASSVPQTTEELKEWLNHRAYPEGWIYAQEHAWQTQTDDDELDLAIMMFDDDFADKHPDRVAFLLRPELELPTELAKNPSRFTWRESINDLSPKGNSGGAVYAILLIIEDSCWLTDLLGPFRFKGTRLPDFGRFLQNVPPTEIEKSNKIAEGKAPGKWPQELVYLKEIADGVESDQFEVVVREFEKKEKQKFKQLDQSDANWIKKRMPSKIQSDDHFLQIDFRTKATFPMSDGPDLKFEENLQWYFFDDLWAGSHPELAKSLLHYATQPLSLFANTG